MVTIYSTLLFNEMSVLTSVLTSMQIVFIFAHSLDNVINQRHTPRNASSRNVSNLQCVASLRVQLKSHRLTSPHPAVVSFHVSPPAMAIKNHYQF